MCEGKNVCSKYSGQWEKSHLVFFCNIVIGQVLHILLFDSSFGQNSIFELLSSNVTEIDRHSVSGNKQKLLKKYRNESV